MSLALAPPMVDDTRHRVDICRSATLAHTHVTILGVLDTDAVHEIDDAIQIAEDNDHTVSFELGELTLATPGALTELMTR